MESIKKVLLYTFSVLWVILMALNTNVHGFVAFLLFVVYMILIVKKHPVIADIVGTVINIAVLLMTNGAELSQKFSGVGEKLYTILGVGIGSFILYKMVSATYREQKQKNIAWKERVDRDIANGIVVCPRCGCRSIHHDPHGIYPEYGDIYTNECIGCGHVW